MKKILVAASIAIMLLMPLIFGGCNSSEREGFAIYLTKDDIPVSQMEALSRVEIADTPLIGINDIEGYHWDTHDVELTVETYEKVSQLKVPTSGVSFVVCVDRQPIYWGAFWAMYSSSWFDGITIWYPLIIYDEMPANSITIRAATSPSNAPPIEDLRLSPIIKDSLEEAGKLK